MCCNHLSNRVCIDQTREKDERNQMVVEDFGVEEEVCGNQGPGYEEGNETKKSAPGFVPSLAADFDHIEGAIRMLAFAMKGNEARTIV
jgi:hypothetical protein